MVLGEEAGRGTWKEGYAHGREQGKVVSYKYNSCNGVNDLKRMR